MSNPTTPFGWQMPTNTDLVTDLPADFEVFGQAVATSMGDLLGGTTGQYLAKNSATDMDFIWVTDAAGDITGVTAGTGISGGGTSGTVTVTNSMATEIAAKADLIVGTGAATFDNLTVGANGTVLTADSTVSPTGLKWATPASGGMTLISTSTLSGTTFTISSIPSGYVNLFMIVKNATQSSTGNCFYRMNGLSTGIYTDVQDALPVSNRTYSLTSMTFAGNPATTPQTGMYVIEIPNYTNTTTTKNIRISGCITPQAGGANAMLFNCQIGANITAAITSFTFGTLSSAPGFNGGTVELYGVK